MRTMLVTGGCGFIGSNYIHYVLENDADVTGGQLRLPDLAGNLAKPDRRGEATRVPVRPRRRDRPRRGGRGFGEGLISIVHFAARATSIAASSTPDRSCAPTSWAPRSCSTPRGRTRSNATSRSVPTRSMGSLGPTGAFTEETPLAAQQPLCCQQGQRRPARPQLRPHVCLPALVTRCSNNYGRISPRREADPAVHQQH